MWLLRRLGVLGIAIIVLALGLGAEAQAPRKGGVLRVGILGEPPALDLDAYVKRTYDSSVTALR